MFKKMVAVQSILIFAATLCLCGHSSAKQADKIMTTGQAIARANEFAKMFGWKPSAKPRALLDKESGEFWTVEYPPKGKTDFMGIDIVIHRTTRDVVFAHDGSFNSKISSKVKTTKEQAIESAKKYINIAGIPMNNLILESAQTISNTARSEDLRWEIDYQMMHLGYPISGAGVDVEVHPVSGALISLIYSDQPLLPKSANPQLKKEEAVQKAREYLKDKFKVDSLKSAKLYFDMPNNFWETGKYDECDFSKPPKLVWLVVFNWDECHIAEVQVDAEDGRILGGMHCD